MNIQEFLARRSIPFELLEHSALDGFGSGVRELLDERWRNLALHRRIRVSLDHDPRRAVLARNGTDLFDDARCVRIE